MSTEPPLVVARAIGGLVFDTMQSVLRLNAWDLMDALLRLTVMDANFAPLSGKPDLARRYAGLSEVLPDDARQPISINAVSRSTGLSFETARRRIHRMTEAGLCRETPRGVILTGEMLATPEMLQEIGRTYGRLREVRAALAVTAPDFALIQDSAPVASPLADPARLCSRSTSKFVLRYLETDMPVMGDVVSSILALGVGVLGARNPDGEMSSDLWTSPRLLTEAERVPVGAAALSRELRLARETTRRRLEALTAREVLLRKAEGYIINPAFQITAAAEHRRRIRAGQLQQLYTGLHRLGVDFDA